VTETTTYADSLTLREGRERYFAAAGFAPDGGYDAKWVRLAVGGVPVFAFPNTPSRVRAVRYHDVHHVATGYPTTWTGEAEIGAWEVASGCADHTAAWVLNLYAMTLGLWFAPRAVFRAFVRGRSSRNCYREPWSDALLDENLGDLRDRLGLRKTAFEVRAADRVAFAGWCCVGLALQLAAGLPLWIGLAALVT
jgi:hypothetical protein